jgi:diadenosine tetraphosphatase ApaH/serine/threonine PP2A family protein phosphatase
MRVLVISDIHANLTALEAVLKDAGPVDEVWCLGDLIGYGPDPNDVVERIKALPNLKICLLGNHDVALLGEMNFAVFNNEARKSLLWQQSAISSKNLAYLRTLPQTTQVKDKVTLAHGSPRDPIWEYVINTLIARLNFEAFQTPYCFVGHSHIQCYFQLDVPKDRITLEICTPNQLMQLSPRIILNPGSVGQPRDHNPKAAYAIYDPEAETWLPRRVEYDIESVQKRIRAAGLPEKHAARLADGW